MAALSAHGWISTDSSREEGGILFRGRATTLARTRAPEAFAAGARVIGRHRPVDGLPLALRRSTSGPAVRIRAPAQVPHSARELAPAAGRGVRASCRLTHPRPHFRGRVE